MAKFPTPEWLTSLKEKLNSDVSYRQTAHNWEGDMLFIIDPTGPLVEKLIYYIDLWHGECRDAYPVVDNQEPKAAFILKGAYDQFLRVMKGELDPLQAMLTRKLTVQGNMVVMMRNVPTVLSFVRCCREVTDEVL